MTSKSAGFGSKTLATPPSYQTEELKRAIRAVLRFGDPDVADALFQEPSVVNRDPSGRRVYG